MDFQQAVEKELRHGRSKATWWAFAVLFIGAVFLEAIGVPSGLALALCGILAVIIFFVLLQGSFKLENVERDAGALPPVIVTTVSGVFPTSTAEKELAEELAKVSVEIGRSEAERIIREYGAVLANAKGVIYPVSLLPYAKERIRDAIRVSILYLIEDGAFGITSAVKLETAYVLLADFVSEEEFEEFKRDEIPNEIPRTRPELLEHGETAQIILRAAIDEGTRLYCEINQFESWLFRSLYVHRRAG